MKIAILGNSARNAGVHLAADLAMAGHEVRLAPLAGDRLDIDAIARDGIRLEGPAAELTGGRPGVARLAAATADPAEATDGAELVIVDMESLKYEAHGPAIAAALRPGQVVHVDTHGYWAALRLWPFLVAAGRTDVVVTETVAPIASASWVDGTVHVQKRRRALDAGAFPSERSAAALGLLARAVPAMQPARDVLQTNLANGNLLVHPAMLLLNVGWFDRAEAEGQRADCYGEGVTAHVSRLAAAQDREVALVAQAYGVPSRSAAEAVRRLYGGEGDDFRAAVKGCDYYQSLGPLPAATWRGWGKVDLTHTLVPMVALARMAGVKVPIHEGYVALFAALLGCDPVAEGLTPERLGIAGMDRAALGHFLRTGRRGD
ncbi:MAG: NAD/NADP octopine/nopaline dehydrogenase family protein [Alphaproteobacteria bacterium]